MPQQNLLQTLAKRKKKDWIIFCVLLAGSIVLGYRCSSSTLLITVRAHIYQTLSNFGPPPRYPQRTAIVLLDDEDYWRDHDPTPPVPKPPQLAGRSPTNRAYLAALLDRLTRAHVGLIVLDFDLRSPEPKAGTGDLPEYGPEDAALFCAIRNMCAHQHQIVLATELTRPVGGELVENPNIFDYAGLPQSCVHKGYIELPRDIRRVPATLPLAARDIVDSLALAAVKAVDPVAYDRVASRDETDFPYSQFLPLSSFARKEPGRTLFTGRDILGATPDELAPQLLNRIVLIGADWHTLALGQGPSADSHPTPAGDLPGVLLHANYIEAALQRGTAKPFPELLAVSLEILVVLFISVVGMYEIHWLWKWSAVFLSSLGVVIFSYLSFHTFGLVLDFFFPLIFVVLHSYYEHRVEWRHPERKE